MVPSGAKVGGGNWITELPYPESGTGQGVDVGFIGRFVRDFLKRSGMTF